MQHLIKKGKFLLKEEFLEDYKKYKKDFENAELVEIQFMTSLHYETYELCKESNQFLLAEQRQGYA